MADEEKMISSESALVFFFFFGILIYLIAMGDFSLLKRVFASIIS